MPDSQSEKVPRVVISEDSIRDWQGLIVELEQSSKACGLAIDLLEQITSSLQVSVQSLQEQESASLIKAEYR